MNRVKFTAVFSGLMVMVFLSVAVGQVPQEMNYQCVLTDTAGAPLSGIFSVDFSVYDAVSGGIPLWSETQSVTVANGFCSVLLGSNTPLPLTLFDNTPRFLGVKVGTDPELSPRQVFATVAYAFSSQSAKGIPGKVQFTDNVGIRFNGLPYESLIISGSTDSTDEAAMRIGPAGAFNNRFSGKITFEEDLAFHDSTTETFCGFAIRHDGAMNQLMFEAGCTTPDTILLMNRQGRIAIGTAITPNILTVQPNAASDPIADAWTVYSSARWKTNVQNIENPLEKVKQLRGVYYQEKPNQNRIKTELALDGGNSSPMSNFIESERKLGVIAEEVGAVIPEVVTYEANGVDARSVDYSRMVALLIEAIKDQQKEIEELQYKINNLSK